ncbi:hypothetical protein B0H14DRAFT_3874211 [Mycena olivaceomarginata]|nr:hypothetical protein B0H14DRAFT_3874211 [Mycena olivaceomarginata]
MSQATFCPRSPALIVNIAPSSRIQTLLHKVTFGMGFERYMTEEAALGNFKSASTRALMGLKFGGLMEACETGCVVGRVGQVIVAEISEAATIPGLARAMYLGHQCSQALVCRGEQRVGGIIFSMLPPSSDPNNPGANRSYPQQHFAPRDIM